MTKGITRRKLLNGIGLVAAPALLWGGYEAFSNRRFKRKLLKTGERLATRAHQLIGRNALAREYGENDLSPDFRTNGSTRPESDEWAAHARNGFANWRLQVGGLVETPRSFSMAELRAFPARTQITRHDCVEGWSAIGQWTGVPLSTILNAAGLTDDARYIVFSCSDTISDMAYYESIGLIAAFHPQTILAYGMNGAPLPTGHGAPLRLRVERQLGYKHAKFVKRIDVVADFGSIGFGKGGFWEDINGYEWYAGI